MREGNGRILLANCDKNMKFSTVILITIKFLLRCEAILNLEIWGFPPQKGGFLPFSFSSKKWLIELDKYLYKKCWKLNSGQYCIPGIFP